MALRVFWFAVLSVLLFAGPPVNGAMSALTQTQILDLRIGLTPRRTRVVFDLSGPTAYTFYTLDKPTRLVVDIPHSASDFDPDTLYLRGTPIARIQTAKQADDTLRYMFDLTGETRPTLFLLEPQGKNGHRLVLDLQSPEDTLDAVPAGDTPMLQAPVPKTGSADSTKTWSAAVSPETAASNANPVASSGAMGVWSGYISLEARLFPDSPAFPRQRDQDVSAAIEPEYYLDWANGRQQFAFSPFYRYDSADDKRTHGDIRELYWRLEQDRLAVKVGIDVVFWGVTESQHLVDIINQTDLVENIDGEEKLGQPMLNLDYFTNDWGTWQFYLLPYFRERTYPGERGRLRTEPAVDMGDALYQSGDKQKHIDFALRWSRYIGDWDVGLAHFSGTGREPLLLPGGSAQRPRLAPKYLQIDQTSVDVQATKGAWLWKLEAIYNQNDVNNYYAYVGGFEYTRFGVADSSTDLGLLLEYNHDQRDGDSLLALENDLSVLQNDVFAGFRLTGNDIASSRLLAGVTVDLDNQSTFVNIEAVRRLGESWTITLEARMFINTDDDDPLYFFRKDDYVEIQFARYF